MSNHVLDRTQLIPKPLETVFPFFADPANLEQITPPFLRFRVVTPAPMEMRAGLHVDYELSLFGVPLRWRTHITEFEPGVRFVDEQEAGPYALWRHSHTFEADGNFTRMRDHVEYREPLGVLGRLAHRLFVERLLNRIFEHRRQAIERHFAASDTSTQGR